MCEQSNSFSPTLETLLVDWKLIVFSFFLHGSFVLKYTDSSNQRDSFLYGSLVLRICPIKSVEYACTQKSLQQEQTFFLQCSSLFLCATVSSLLNKESLVQRYPVTGGWVWNSNKNNNVINWLWNTLIINYNNAVLSNPGRTVLCSFIEQEVCGSTLGPVKPSAVTIKGCDLIMSNKANISYICNVL